MHLLTFIIFEWYRFKIKNKRNLDLKISREHGKRESQLILRMLSFSDFNFSTPDLQFLLDLSFVKMEYKSILLHSNKADEDFDHAYNDCMTDETKRQICLDYIDLAVELISKPKFNMIVEHYKVQKCYRGDGCEDRHNDLNVVVMLEKSIRNLLELNAIPLEVIMNRVSKVLKQIHPGEIDCLKSLQHID